MLTVFGGILALRGMSVTGSANVVTVNAASYKSLVAPGSIAAAFGAGMCTASSAATSIPLPTELDGVTIDVISPDAAPLRAQLFYVSPGQINFLVPASVKSGDAELVVSMHGDEVARGGISISNSAPAIFSQSYDGKGLPAGFSTYDGVLLEPLVNSDGSPRIIQTGTPWKPNYLTLFGTGVRNAAGLKVRVGSQEVTPSYAGAQGTFEGLDQINLPLSSFIGSGLTDITIVSGDQLSNTTRVLIDGLDSAQQTGLTISDVQTIIGQGVARAQQLGVRATVAVTDHEGTVLGVFRMTGASPTTRIGVFDVNTRLPLKPVDTDGLQDIDVPASLAAISKAGTASFFSTQGNAFSTRTASFIIQEHFPPLITNQPGGPLFGVQFSQLPCSDVKIPNLPLGLSGDPGGVPIYKNGVAAGGVGIEVDGLYTIDLNPADEDQPVEEVVAVAATLGFEAPASIRGDQILADGIRLPFLNAGQTGGPAPPFASLPGTVDPNFPIRAAAPTSFNPLTLGGVPGRVDSRYFPFKDGVVAGGTRITAAQVNQILTQAAQQAAITRAAIRRPLGSRAEVNIAVVDTDGNVIGLFSTSDAPIFGFDVSVQKARTAAFFSSATAGTQLRAAESGRFVKFADAAAADGIALNGTIAFTDRANGFLSRPFFPDGIEGTANGPFSKPLAAWSPFNDGLQIALVKTALSRVLSNQPVGSCTAIASLKNGIQTFAGSVPLYRNGVLVGGIGVSGDGIDQDDLIAAAGSVGFEAPESIRSDQVFVRGVRLPFVKFPRHPNL